MNGPIRPGCPRCRSEYPEGRNVISHDHRTGACDHPWHEHPHRPYAEATRTKGRRASPVTAVIWVRTTPLMRRQIEALAKRHNRTRMEQIRVLLSDAIATAEREVDPRAQAGNLATSGSSDAEDPS